MASMSATDLMLLAANVGQGLSLVALYMRLRFLAKREITYNEHIVALLRELPDETEIDEHRREGVLHRLTITKGTQNHQRHPEQRQSL
jgi:hypothetical protein